MIKSWVFSSYTSAICLQSRSLPGT